MDAHLTLWDKMKKIAIRAFALLKIAPIKLRKLHYGLFQAQLQVIIRKQNHNLDKCYVRTSILPNNGILKLDSQGKCFSKRIIDCSRVIVHLSPLQ